MATGRDRDGPGRSGPGFPAGKLMEQRPRSSGFKSFLNWFKKVESLQKQNDQDAEEYTAGVDSDSSEEHSSSSSTATVASFAFLPANKYRPYGDASPPEKYFSPGPYTETYYRLIMERNRRRSMDKNITLRKKYSLYTSGTLPTSPQGAAEHNATDEPARPASLYDTFSLPSLGRMNASTGDSPEDRKTASLSTRQVKSGTHVKGKRRAPQPPTASDFIKSYRKKRKAPPPPLVLTKVDSDQTSVPSPEVGKRELKKSERDSLQAETKNKDSRSPSVEISPKPWYKRESKQKPNKNNPPEISKKTKTKHEYPEVGFFRCSQFLESMRNHNSDKNEAETKNEKRVSRFLPNISELDREAAEIIKKHKANLNNDENNVAYWLTPTSPNKPSSTQELISKFNALSTNDQQNNQGSSSEIKLTSESIIRSNSKDHCYSPMLNDHRKVDKNKNIVNKESVPLNRPTYKAIVSPVLMRKCEISQSFQAEVFSAIPSLAQSSQVGSSEKLASKKIAPGRTAEDEEKLAYIEEKLKLKELLKEMKNSLPKRPKPQKQNSSNSESDNGQITAVSEIKPKAEAVSPEISTSKEITKEDRTKIQSVEDLQKITIAPVQNNKSFEISNPINKEHVKTVDENPKVLISNLKIIEKSIKDDIKKNFLLNKDPVKPSSSYEKLIINPIYSNKVDSSAQTSGVIKTTITTQNNAEKFKLTQTNDKITTEPLYTNLKDIGASESKENILEKKKIENVVSTPIKEEILPENTSLNATNVLLKQLEQAISDGDDITAAKLAKELAVLKVNCLVTCSPSIKDKEISYKRIKVYIEDQFSHQGPIPLQISENASIGDLKMKVEKELNIPTTSQRWIIGKQLAADDKEQLVRYNNSDFETPVFLYVIATKEKTTPTESVANGIVLEKILEKPETENVPAKSDPEKSPDRVTEKIEIATQSTSANLSKPPAYSPTSSPILKNVKKNTWACTDCTLINSLLSPLCSACGKKYEANEQDERNRNDAPPEDAANHYKQLLNLDDQDLVHNVEIFECPVCFQFCEPTMGVTLRECIHSFCRECLQNTIKHSDEPELKCPYRDRDYSCESVIQEREIRALVNKTVYERHLAKSVKIAENQIRNAFHCKTPDCKGWCIFDDNVNEFSCPACKKNNCLTCQVIHEGKNCRDYQQSLNPGTATEGQRTKNMLDEMVKRGEALACPSCQVIMMKKWGCDWVRCSMCKTEICWVTRGPRWGPKGKGDVSAGCQCGVNGVKCHPKCNYCH